MLLPLVKSMSTGANRSTAHNNLSDKMYTMHIEIKTMSHHIIKKSLNSTESPASGFSSFRNLIRVQTRAKNTSSSTASATGYFFWHCSRVYRLYSLCNF